MLLLQPITISSALTGFPDHSDPERLYLLPHGLELARTASGTPDFMLLRYHGDFTSTEGGLLRMLLLLRTLEALPLEIAGDTPGRKIRPLPFHTGRFQLRLRSLVEGAEDGLTGWETSSVTGSELSVPGVALTAGETQLLHDLLESEQQHIVEVVLALRYRGVVGGMPWIVSARKADLHEALLPALGADPVRADEVVAAFFALQDRHPDLLQWQCIAEAADAATEPSEAQFALLLPETALRALDVFFDVTPCLPNGQPYPPARYTLQPMTEDREATFVRDLRTFRMEDRTHWLTWSVTDLYQQVASDEVRHQLFPVVRQVSPFQSFQVHVVNTLPFDPAYLREVHINLRYPSATGVPEHKTIRFDESTESLARFHAVRPLGVPFKIDYQVTTTLAPPGGAGWPLVTVSEQLTTDHPVIEISRQASQMDFVRLEVEEAAFDYVSSLAVQIYAEEPALEEIVTGAFPAPEEVSFGLPPTQSDVQAEALAHLTLTREKSSAWVALPGTAPDAVLRIRCDVHPPEGIQADPLVLFDGPLVDRTYRVAAGQFEVLEPDSVTVSLAPEAAARFPFVAVALTAHEAPEMDEGRLYTLQPDEVRIHSLFRKNVFEPVRFRYRIHYVATDANGENLPMASTAWMEAAGTLLMVSPPLQAG